MPFLDVRNQRIHYQDTGGAGPALVFSHGLLMDGSMWDAQVRELRGRYRCITWDERGHGQTGPALQPFTYDDSAEDLLGLLDRWASARHACRHVPGRLRQPARRRASAADCPGARVHIEPGHGGGAGEGRGLRHAHRLVGERRSDDELAEAVAGIVIGPGWEGSDEWIARWKRMDRSGLRAIYGALLAREDFTPRLGELDVPALVIWGEQDLAISRERALALADGLPQGSLEVVPGAGHGVNFTHPDPVNALLTRFLEQSAGGAR